MFRKLQTWFASLAESWSGWIGDRDLDLAIRRHLDGEGFFGDSAKFQNMRLAAVQRPGWLQVFVMQVEAKSRVSGERQAMFGLVRQDERYNRVDIEIFAERFKRNQRFSEWSQDLIQVRNPGRL